MLVAVSAGQARTQAALAQRLGLDRTVMTYLLDDLESHALVTRRPTGPPDPDHSRRQHRPVAQTRGRPRIAEATPLHNSDEERQLRVLLERITQTSQREALGLDDDC
ncbi:helix-turn-helix domain-containing protein [Streptomyces sp. NPDC002012]|uniref:helix-turn-helix domain-containing protein n=1 Tax=Streptomyces sp. NPDC002012 TaxID=3154532 RepID=UPI00332232EB